jgi:hypothetical protein
MDQTGRPEPDRKPAGAEAPLLVAVTRTGGFAGIPRVWKAEPPEDQAPEWITLIDRCPWDEHPDRDTRGADRFQWSIRAKCAPDQEREADLPDSAVTGPWRDLVDAVRAWTSDRPRNGRAADPPQRA